MKRRLMLAAAAALAANALFFAIAVSATFVPRQRLIERVARAFALGDLGFKDYLFFDSRRGFNQYNDCAVLQMITNDTHDHLADAAGPMHYLSDMNGDAQCRALRGVLGGNAGAGRYIATRHARYWHGYNAAAAFLLWLLPLSTVRLIFKVVVYALVIALPAAATRTDRRLLRATLAVSVVLLSFYALPYFAQSLTHAPGDICVLSALTLLLLSRGRILRDRRFIICCAIFGSLLAYLDDLIGVIPIGVAFFFTFSYLLGVSDGRSRSQAWRTALEGLAGIALGGVMTVVIKQVVALSILGRGPVDDWLRHFAFYVSPAHSAGLALTRVPRFFALILTRIPFLLPFAMLVNATRMLTYDSRTGATALLAASILAWIAAGIIAWSKGKEIHSDFLAFAAGFGLFVGWVLLTQTHASEHAVFMVRIEIIPIALGWAALAWTASSPRHRDHDRGNAC